MFIEKGRDKRKNANINASNKYIPGNKSKFVKSKRFWCNTLHECLYCRDRINFMYPQNIRILKDLYSLNLYEYIGHTNIECNVNIPDKNNLNNINIILRNDKWGYLHDKFTFNIVLPYYYPYECPTIKCLNKIYLPHINNNGFVKLDIMNQWVNDNTLQDIILELIVVLDNPIIDDDF